MVKKAIESLIITYYWKLLDSKLFDTLAGSMVDKIEQLLSLMDSILGTDYY